MAGLQPLPDAALEAVAAALLSLDPEGARTARALRRTIDMLLDGRNTGRFRWEQLHKTEKTHAGTLVEINLQREFEFDGEIRWTTASRGRTSTASSRRASGSG